MRCFACVCMSVSVSNIVWCVSFVCLHECNTMSLCLFVCVCAPGVTSSGNDRVLERASLWMIRRQASQSKDEVFCLILCSLEFKTVDPVDILATRAGRVCGLRLEERGSSLSPPPPPPHLSRSLSRSLSLALSIGEILIIAVGIPLCYRTVY